MALEIRAVTAADVPAWLTTRRTTFLLDPAVSQAQVEWWTAVLESDRCSGAWDGTHCVATLQTFATTLTVPGGALITADALTAVTVNATHRRRGLLRGMLTPSLQAAKERGEVVSILRAAEWPIYGRYGYWPSSEVASYEVQCDRGADVGEPSGLILRTVSLDEAPALGAEVYAGMRARGDAGHIDRTPRQWERQLGLGWAASMFARQQVCIAALDGDGRPQGLLTWSAADTKFEQDPVQVSVHDLIFCSDAGYRALWSYLIHLDLVISVRIDAASVAQALPWLLSNGRLMSQIRREDDLWLRLLDVPAALSARRYSCTDRLVLQVIDEDTGGYGQGTYTLDGGLDHAECVSTPGATADIVLSQRALAAVYLGGFSVRTQQLAGLVDEQTTGAAARLAAMMHTDTAPWNATSF